MNIEAEEPNDTEDNVLELTPEDEVTDQTEGEDDEEELLVSIGEEAAPASEEAPEWVREVRKRNRELERELAELRKGKAADVPEIGDKPTLEGCDYDEGRFEQELDSWKERKSTAERAKVASEEETGKAQERWQTELGTYADQSKTLGAKDFKTAEDEVVSILTPAQQAILVTGAENKALLVYALGKNPAKLRELANITDPVKFAFAAARLEGQTKMEKRRPTSSPESTVKGNAPLSRGSDKTLERLEKEAEKSGNWDKVFAHNRAVRKQAKK